MRSNKKIKQLEMVNKLLPVFLVATLAQVTYAQHEYIGSYGVGLPYEKRYYVGSEYKVN